MKYFNKLKRGLFRKQPISQPISNEIKNEKNKIYFKPVYPYYIFSLNDNKLAPDKLNESELESSRAFKKKIFVTYKSKLETQFEIYSSFGDTQAIRNPLIYKNHEIVQDHFKSKYEITYFENRNVISFGNNLFVRNGITQEDFEDVILPNLVIDLMEVFDPSSITFNRPFKVVFNWDFFRDINSYNKPNRMYIDDQLNSKYLQLEFDSMEQVMCCVFDYLFEYPFYSPDAVLEGLYFESSPPTDKTVSKFFEYNNSKKVLIPKNRGWECTDDSSQNEIFISDLYHLMNYFNELNRPFCEIGKQ